MTSSRAGSTSQTEAGPSFFYGCDTFLRAASALRKGETVVIPTETVYGLAADASNAVACRQIFEIKGRPFIDPLIVHVGTLDQVDSIAHWNDDAFKLAQAFWPGPLTLILQKKSTIPDIVTAGKETVAVRMPDHSMAIALMALSGLALAAPSANPFGYLSPTKLEHVKKNSGR